MHLLEVKDLSKTYDGREVVRGVDIVVKRGEIVGLLGPNGAGKTTTFYMIVGVIPPNRGRITFDITILPICPFMNGRVMVSVILPRMLRYLRSSQWKTILWQFWKLYRFIKTKESAGWKAC